MDIKLIKPTITFEKHYREFHDDWITSGEQLVPFVLKYYEENFKVFIDALEGFSIGKNIDDSFVNHRTYWLLINDNTIIGTLNLRHRLNDRLMKEGGHIGYGIRPSYRKKGYGKIILKEGLDKAKELGIKKVLLTCDKNNIGSSKIISYNGGILESEDLFEGKLILRYWINLG